VKGHALTVLYAVAADASSVVSTPSDTVIDLAALAAVTGVPAPVAVAVVRWTEDGWPSWHGLATPDTELWWDGLRRSVRSVRAQLAARRAQLADVEFRDAAVAMCALVAAADGTIDDRERAAMLAAMAHDEVLAQFDVAEVQRLFDSHVDRLRTDPDAGRRAAHRDIARLRGRPGHARSVVALGGVIGRADGVFDALEREAVRAVATALDVSAADFAVQSVDGTHVAASEETR
jgi:tellurite resistance protein